MTSTPPTQLETEGSCFHRRPQVSTEIHGEAPNLAPSDWELLGPISSRCRLRTMVEIITGRRRVRPRLVALPSNNSSCADTTAVLAIGTETPKERAYEVWSPWHRHRSMPDVMAARLDETALVGKHHSLRTVTKTEFG